MVFEFRWVVQDVLYVFAVLLLGNYMATRYYSRTLHLMSNL